MKINYGIDLGTTNSAISRIEKGEPTIKKSDTLKDTTPSCVGFNKKQSVLVGDSAWNLLKSDKLRAMRKWNLESNTFIEFKRTMGADEVYHSSHMNRDFTSEELSAEVLKKLRSFISEEEFQSVVVTVPARFDIRQKDATLRAAQLASFQHCELLQEPIAASMAYGLGSDSKDGYWVVFDFGGGTFDAALIKVEEGIMKVLDTDGDNYLGGKNLDMAIVDEIIIPYLRDENNIEEIIGNEEKKRILQEAMKYYAEEAKIQLSFKEEHNILSDLGDIPGEDDDGEEFELDITLDRESLKKVISPIFQRAVDITKDLLSRNNLSGDRLDSLILVGGPTYSTILREMLEEQIIKPDTSIDPMTAVAVGASLYASTIDVSEEVKESSRDRTKVQLDIGFEPSTVESEEWITIKTLPGKTEGEIPKPLFAEIIRGDQAWSSGKTEVNEKGEIIEAKLNKGKPNNFELALYDSGGNRIPVEPSEFTIIQGSKIGSATLPYYIGVEIKRHSDGRLIFREAKGLEVNQPLPAKGTVNGLKTQQQLLPGNKENRIKIPIYQGDYYSKGTRAIYNELVYSVVITGEDVPAFLPEGSDVDLTMTTDRSGRIEKIEAFLPYLEYTVEIPIPESKGEDIDIGYLEDEIGNAKSNLRELSLQGYSDQEKLDGIDKEIEYLNDRLQQGRNDSDRKREVLESLRKSLKEIDRLSDDVEWPKLEARLREEFQKLEKADEELGNERSNSKVDAIRQQLDEVIRKKDSKLGQAMLDEIQELFFALTFIYQLIAFVKHHKEHFHSFDWKDPQRAQQLLNKAVSIIATDPRKETLHPVVVELINELPETQKPKGNDEVLLG